MKKSSEGFRQDGFEAGVGAAAEGFGETERAWVQVTSRNGGVFRAQAYRCVNVADQPHLGEAFLAGTLSEVVAPDEDATYALALAQRYHDPQAQLFALVIPDTLRHREFALRAELLADMSRAGVALPEYIRNFNTVFGLQGLQALRASRAQGTAQAVGSEGLLADGGSALAAPELAAGAHTAQGQGVSELEVAWSRVELERERLAEERRALDEVRERVERDSARMQQAERELEQLRAELDEKRSELQAAQLNLEQRELQMAQGIEHVAPAEATQIVTDDQFIEVFQSEAEEVEAEVEDDFYGWPPEATGMVPAPVLEGSEGGAQTLITPADASHIAPEYLGEDNTQCALVDGQIVLSARLSAEVLDAFAHPQALEFFVQGAFLCEDDAAEDAYPFLGLVLAKLDEDEQARHEAAWAIDPLDAARAPLLEQLRAAVALRVALYDEAGDLHGVLQVYAPLQENVAWICTRIHNWFQALGADHALRAPGAFQAAAERWLAPGFARIGALRHNFSADSFSDALSPRALNLAAGIVGFWSDEPRYTYLIANRAFPLSQFDAIQKRVVRRAVQQGIFIDWPLRRVALGMGLSSDEVELTERLIAEFAEVSIGLRTNDLDPVQEWENWDALMGLAGEVGANLDPEMLELAEASLKRAQDYQAAMVMYAPDEAGVEESGVEQSDAAQVDHTQVDADPHLSVDSLIVARRSETTGVTYFLPDDALLDTFDDLSTMSMEDLELLLEDPAGRLEAAQVLVERFGGPGARLALQAAEQMTVGEVAALAKFVESRAEGLEAELVRCVEAGGPSATFVGASALAAIRSTPAIPTLLNALRDPHRQGNVAYLVRALGGYGDAILADLKRVITQDGPDDASVALLQELERLDPGLLSRLAAEPSKRLRDAARAARASGA